MKKITFIFICLTIIFSCKKDDKPVENNNTNNTNSNVINGNISGSIKQFNQNGELLSSGLNGVTITLDNDNVSTTSDTSGKYNLQGVKPGIYTIFYSKPGCETYQIQQVNFPGNGILFKDATLIETPTFSLESATMTMDSSNLHSSIKVSLKLSPNSKDVWVGFISGPDNSVDINKSNYYGPFVYKIPASTSTYTFKTNSLSSNNFGKIYTYAGNQSSYYDYATKTNKQQGFGASLAAIKYR